MPARRPLVLLRPASHHIQRSFSTSKGPEILRMLVETFTCEMGMTDGEGVSPGHICQTLKMYPPLPSGTCKCAHCCRPLSFPTRVSCMFSSQPGSLSAHGPQIGAAVGGGRKAWSLLQPGHRSYTGILPLQGLLLHPTSLPLPPPLPPSS